MDAVAVGIHEGGGAEEEGERVRRERVCDILTLVLRYGVGLRKGV